MLILVIVQKMLIVVQEIIVVFVPAEKATQEIHMVINVPSVSQIFYTTDFKSNLLYFFIFLNPNLYIDFIVPIDTGCKGDIECPTREACINKECQNPCTAIKPCAANAVCQVQNTLPLRTMICTCDTGYVGRGDIACDKYSKYYF